VGKCATGGERAATGCARASRSRGMRSTVCADRCAPCMTVDAMRSTTAGSGTGARSARCHALGWRRHLGCAVPMARAVARRACASATLGTVAVRAGQRVPVESCLDIPTRAAGVAPVDPTAIARAMLGTPAMRVRFDAPMAALATVCA